MEQQASEVNIVSEKMLDRVWNIPHLVLIIISMLQKYL